MKSTKTGCSVPITDLVSGLRSGKLDKDGSAFLQSAESFSAQPSGQDVVQEYLLESGECLELLEFIDFQNKKSAAELTLAFKILERILLRIADDLGEYESTGTFVVQNIMSSKTKTKTIYWMLSQGKSNPVKATLCLLTSMVMLGNQAAKEILSYFAFSHSAIKPLLSRTDVKSPQDIRSCYIQFILAFLITDDNQIIRQVVDQKGLLNAIFHQLKNDKADTIQLLLSTLLSKVVQNASLPKTSKVRLLNDFSLKQVLELYRWKPPQGFMSKKKKSSSKEETEEATLINFSQGEVDKELLAEQVEVREMAHQFLLAICCSRKQGILFHDPSIGTSGKNMNHLITSLLSAADKPHDSKYMRELVISVLAASPDQLRFYLPTLQNSLAPRLSTRWIAAMKFVQQIYKEQNPIGALKGLTEKIPVNKLVTMVSIMTIPAIISQTLLTEALEHNTLTVRHVALKAISHTIKRVANLVQTAATEELVKINVVSAIDTSEFVSRLSRSINKILPDWNLIKACWTKGVSGLQDQPSGQSSTTLESESADTAVLKGLPDITLTQHLHLVLEVQLSLCQLLPDLKANLALDMPQLLNALQDATKMAELAEIDAFHVKVSQLVVKSEELRSLLGTRELGAPLIYGLTRAACHSCDSSVVKMAQSVLLMVLCELGLADYKEELNVWIFCLVQHKSENHCFNQIVDKFLQNQKSFLQQADDFKSSGKISCCMFSPLLIAAIETFKQQSTFGAKSSFICAVLKTVLHLHTDYKALVQFILLKDSAFPKHLLRYCDICSGEKKRPSKRKRTSLDAAVLDVEYLLEDVFEQRHQETVNIDSEKMAALVAYVAPDVLRVCTHQCLFYLGISLSEELACKKEVVKFWCETLLNIVQREMDLAGVQNQNDEAVTMLGSVVPPVYAVVLRHPELLQWFLEAKNSKISRIVTRLASDIFMLVKKSIGLTSNLNQLMLIYYEQLKTILSLQLKMNQNEFHDVLKVDKQVLDLFKHQFTPFVVTSLLETSTSETKIMFSKIYRFCLETSVEFVTRDRIPYISGAWLAQNMACLIDDEASLSLILKLLKVYPIYATTIPCELVDHCFTPSVDNNCCLLSEIVATAISVSPDHHQRFKTCCLTIEVTAQSLPLLLPMAAAFTESVFCHKEDSDSPNLPKEISTVVTNIFQIYFSYIMEVFHDADMEIAENVSQQFCRLLRLWVQMGNIDADNIIKFLIIKQDFSYWALILHRGGRKFISVLKDFIPSVRKLSRLTHACFYVLSEAFSNRSWSRSDLLKDLIGLCIACVKAVETSNPQKLLHQKNAVISWIDMAKQLLKKGLSEEDHTDCLELLCVTYSKFYLSDDNSLGLSVADVHNMIFGHSNFLNIMLTDDKRNSKQKGKLLDLVLATTSLDPSVCKTMHIAVILGSYGATLKPNDQKLLHLLSIYEAHGCKVCEYRPYMWGPAAISHYAIKTKMGPTLHKESRMEEVLALLDKDKLSLTAMKFPLDLELEPQCVQLADSEMYDPRFLLPLVCHLLQPEVLVHCLRFLDSGLLSVAFASLGSNCSSMRSAGYHALALFWEQLEGSRFSTKKIWLHLLECLKNAVTEPNVKLFSMITAFLVRVSSLLLATDDPLYAPVCAFLIRKPVLDVQHIPEFLKLFNSSDLQYRKHRQWILGLMTDGLRQATDFYLCEKAHAFKMILAYSSSSLCDGSSLLQVLELCQAAAKIPSKAIKLVQQHGILAYLHSLWFKRHSNYLMVITTSVALVNILWKSILACRLADINDDESALELEKNSVDAVVGSSRSKSSHFSDNHTIPFAYVTEFLVTLQALVEHLSEIDIANWKLYLETLSSVTNHLPNRKENAQLHSAPHLTDNQVQKLLSLHTKIITNKSCLLGASSDKEQSVGSVDISRIVDGNSADGHNLSNSESEVAASICDEHFAQVILCWCEQRVQRRDNAFHNSECHVRTDIHGPKTAESTLFEHNSDVVCEVLQYVVQHLGPNYACTAHLLQLFQCLALDIKNVGSNCDVFKVFTDSCTSVKNLACFFDIYNYCIGYASSPDCGDKQGSHNRTLILTALNGIFLQLFDHVSAANRPTNCKSELQLNLENLRQVLTTQRIKESLSKMMELQQSLHFLNNSNKGGAVLQITQFVAAVVLRSSTGLLPARKKRHSSGSSAFPKRQKFVT